MLRKNKKIDIPEARKKNQKTREYKKDVA